MPVLDGLKMRFVLSASRTGTVFLSKALVDLCGDCEVVHEPPTSRRMFMLWNAEAAGWIPDGMARRVFVANRGRTLARLNDRRTRIEINPFLHPLAPELHELVEPLYIVHLVREARAWIQSMINFGAAGWRKYLIEHVPFARTVHPQAREFWHKLDTISQFAWRWRLANEQLLSCADNTAHYRRIRYEDLFSNDRAKAATALDQLLSLLPAGTAEMALDLPWTEKINPSRGARVSSWQQWPPETQERVLNICGPLLESFGYAATVER